MKHLLQTVAVALAVTLAVLFGVRELRHRVTARQVEKSLSTIKPKVDVNVSLDINVTDIAAAAAGGAFAWRKMHLRKKKA